jgi:hypothetical protein
MQRLIWCRYPPHLALALFAGFAILHTFVGLALAQIASPVPAQAPTSFFEFLRPGVLNLTVYGGGFISDQYGTTDQGFQLEHSITKQVGVVGRITGYQLYVGSGFDNPLDPGTGHSARYNFARLEGGFDFKPFEGTYFSILGGRDVGDSNAAVVEGDFSSWLNRKSKYPFNISISSNYDSQNGISSGEIDLRAMVYSREKYLLLLGAGGAIFGGGFVPSVAGQGGPMFGIYFPDWRIGIDTQTGYGSARQYGEISIYKQIKWTE